MKVTKLILSDLRFYGGTTITKKFLTFFWKHSFLVMLNYRLGHYFFHSKFPLSNLFVIYLRYRQLKYSSCQISYEALIGRFLSLPHPVAIVIGKGVKIEDNVTIYQSCTLGEKGKSQYPILHENSTVYPGCIVVGNISIGQGAIIGANSFVDKSVEANTVFKKK